MDLIRKVYTLGKLRWVLGHWSFASVSLQFTERVPHPLTLHSVPHPLDRKLGPTRLRSRTYTLVLYFHPSPDLSPGLVQVPPDAYPRHELGTP